MAVSNKLRCKLLEKECPILIFRIWILIQLELFTVNLSNHSTRPIDEFVHLNFWIFLSHYQKYALKINYADLISHEFDKISHGATLCDPKFHEKNKPRRVNIWLWQITLYFNSIEISSTPNFTINATHWLLSTTLNDDPHQNFLITSRSTILRLILVAIHRLY